MALENHDPLFKWFVTDQKFTFELVMRVNNSMTL